MKRKGRPAILQGATVGGLVNVEQLGLSPTGQRLAEENGHYYRERFTVRKLARMLDLNEPWETIQ